MKPKNILIKDRNTKITDLGISKIMEQNNNTETNTLAFTPRYASIESVNGNAVFESDIWSYGLIFYEIMSNNKPWSD